MFFIPVITGTNGKMVNPIWIPGTTRIIDRVSASTLSRLFMDQHFKLPYSLAGKFLFIFFCLWFMIS
ncbi:hypothetical protein [Pedobacter steynii]|uniref:Uncharacterized protein n=1 Tax=Pedobacter steynii TaxID=430522 RepID=A0A1D7QBT8_9SPHI|nr:hypothetical protein [Pedobacter steynii]AOM76143.1 hypothetical protein BFS30_02550 [Pedobacter steynii]